MAEEPYSMRAGVIEFCDTHHYGILFKVLAEIPDILRRCGLNYTVGGGTAIVKHLETQGVRPNIMDIWDSYDWDVYTDDIDQFLTHIIYELTWRLAGTTTSGEPIIMVIPITHENKKGFQLCLNVCDKVVLPKKIDGSTMEGLTYRKSTMEGLRYRNGLRGEGWPSFVDGISYKLQFMDIFEEKSPSRSVKIEGINYYTPRNMYDKIQVAIRERSVGISFDINYDRTSEHHLRALVNARKNFKRILKEYLNQITRGVSVSHPEQYGLSDIFSTDEVSDKPFDDKYNKLSQEAKITRLGSSLNNAIEDVYDRYEHVITHYSYSNVVEYIQHRLKVQQDMNKLNKMRLRAELLGKYFGQRAGQVGQQRS